MDVNRVTLIGRVGDDPVRETTGDGETTRFWVITAIGLTAEPMTHAIVTHGKLGTICAQYVRRDSRVYIEGRIRPDRQIVAEQLIMLGARRPKAA